MIRRIALLMFDGFQLQGVAGPVSAFEIANRLSPQAYSLEPIAPYPGPVVNSVGISMSSGPPANGPYDTILMPGGAGLQDIAVLNALLSWLDREVSSARRVATICTGAYLAAEAGLLDGLRATTHWDAVRHFGRLYPQIRLQPNEIVVQDGNIWSSAGISAGIDLALALIEDDLGHSISIQVARQLVVPHRRTGGQMQFSSALNADGFDGRFSELLLWIREHLSDRLDIETLARKAAMSPRNFARVFRSDTGMTPAKAIEHIRLEAARSLLQESRKPIEQIAETVGFGDPERMRRAFLRVFGHSPQALRRIVRSERSQPKGPV